MRPSPLLLVLLVATGPTWATDHVVGNRDVAGLRAAIMAANADPTGSHRIVLAEGGLYTLDDALPGHLGLPSFTGKVHIDGRGAEIRRYSETGMTLLEVAAEAHVTLTDLTLAEGSLGAIRNLGTLSLRHVVVSDSSGESARGIVINHGDMLARDSAFTHNEVHGSGRDAGTLINFGSLTLQDSRIVGNSLSRRYPSLAAAPVLNHGQLTITGGAFEDNQVLDEFDGLVSTSVLNLLGGKVSGPAELQVRDERNELAVR
jgi:hypothetical protein